jgi:hypothetical protein
MQRKTIFDTEEFFLEELTDADLDDPVALLEQLMHDCPECQAARARGETPIFGTGEDLLRQQPSGPVRDIIRDKRPRWRTLKRNARR